MVPVVTFKLVFSKTAKRHVRELSTGASSGDKFVPRQEQQLTSLSVISLKDFFSCSRFVPKSKQQPQEQQQAIPIPTSITTRTEYGANISNNKNNRKAQVHLGGFLCRGRRHSRVLHLQHVHRCHLQGACHAQWAHIWKIGDSSLDTEGRYVLIDWLIDWMMMKWLIWVIELRKCWCMTFMNEWDRHHHHRHHILLRKLKKQLENGSELTMIAFFI